MKWILTKDLQTPVERHHRSMSRWLQSRWTSHPEHHQPEGSRRSRWPLLLCVNLVVMVMVLSSISWLEDQRARYFSFDHLYESISST